MFSSTILTMLVAAGSAYAAVIQGEWGIRADFTKCDFEPLEVFLRTDMETTQSSPSAGIVDFKIPSPFNGTLILMAEGSASLVSYPPQEIDIEIFPEPTLVGGVWGNATISPPAVGIIPVGYINQVYWNTDPGNILFPDPDRDVWLWTTSDGGSLQVFYCAPPEAGGPIA
ncbi:hypothetical protein DHEL01_v203076 [Diaporthe helianthi]|uniref:Uncharacterized protein n=1 Tax=Diaporthe helianthi TaxID=158607 RepID=A0A2P5I7Q7_DIAHE|nr:hypothetical protein DHEL01_v203076 [Diaporthe helianthi]